jgi:hypothetical protein
MRAISALLVVSVIGAAATVDVTRTFMLLREGEQLSATAVAELDQPRQKAE